MRRVLTALIALAVAGSCAAAGTQTHSRFKWTDAEGNLHYSDVLPAEAAKYGYDVVNAQGIVIKHVDRAKTTEEKAAAKAEIAKAQAAKDAADRRVHTDQQLLAAYPTEDDLKRAQRHQSEMMDQNLSSARISLQSQEKSLAELLGHAAELESSGKAVPSSLAKRIGDMRKLVEDQRAYITRKEGERDATVARFDEDLAHYRDLKAPKQADRQ
ncbi:MAG TPA: DUF4124 domain-containing protein [Rhodanobacteraceae bacterium]|nr:DUF4124 domain-containing protein [Rhodanobacteraceae bacterium]